MKLGLKITVIMGVLVFASTLTVSLSLVSQARGLLENFAEASLAQGAREVSLQIGEFLGMSWYSAETLASILQQYEFIIVHNRRNFINRALENMVRDNPHIITAWAVFEPDALEGGDLAFMGIEGSSLEDAGRFAPFWFRDGEGVSLGVLPPNYDLPGVGDFYQIPRRTMRGALLCPSFYEVGGEAVLKATISMPIIVDGEFRGAVGVGVSMDRIQEIARANLPFANSLAAVFSNSGIIVAHFIPGRPGGDMRETERPMAGERLDEVIQAIRVGEGINWVIFNPGLNDYLHVAAVPIWVADSGTPWAYVLAYPAAEAMAPVKRMRSVAGLIALIVFAVTIAVMVFVMGSITEPILRVVEKLRDISEGDGDLTKVLPENGSDEIAELSRYFNLTIGKIRKMVVVIKRQAGALSDIGNELVGNMTATASAMNQITANIRSTKGKIIYQSASVTETNATMEQITVSIDKLNAQVEHQAGAVAQTSSAVEEMLANIRSVTAILGRNSQNVRELRESSETGKSSLQEVAADIQEIARESEGLLEINEMMESIASQTNLLSMNAAIEAAYAGGAGKGFSVVAAEIRQLAESSREQSQTVSEVLGKIKESIDSITWATDNVLNKFESIDRGVRAVVEQDKTIQAAMEEQGHGTRQILQASDRVGEITRQVKDGSLEMLEGSREVIHESKNLEKAMQEIAYGINDMATGADQVNMAVDSVNKLSCKNRENISVLVQAISQFKV